MRLLYFMLPVVLAAAVFPDNVRAQDCWTPGYTPPPPGPGAQLHVLAKPVETDVQAGERKSIDLLAGDIGAPSDPAIVPEMKLEGTPPNVQMCGSARLDGRNLIYQGGSECAGKTVALYFSVMLRDPSTCREERAQSVVTITIKPPAELPPPPPPPSACNVPDAPWRLVSIQGGTFKKAEAPAEIEAFTRLVDEESFTVAPFCLMLDPVPADDFDKFLRGVPEDQKRQLFSEVFEKVSDAASPGDFGPVPSAKQISRRMALAYAKHQTETRNRTFRLPTVNELVASVWESWAKHRGAVETELLDISLRTGYLQWTDTRCADGADIFYTVGKAQQGSLTKLCYEESRRDRTGFRLVIR